MIPLALSRSDVANYVQALFLVYFILIFANIILSFVPRMPFSLWSQAVINFIRETTDPYINIFRRILRPIGSGPIAIDLSPMVAIIVLMLLDGIIVGAILE
ncbi:MAG TPA: YggT family protein [Solirubrobacterales bacterium]|nr:YggT family protein [Solirubrobacterales bacterium]